MKSYIAYNRLISVIVPIYQVEKYIKNCIDSIIQQTYQNFELILIDDGSFDSSIDIAKKELLGKDINYRIVSQSNAGQGLARNAGIKASNGEWIIFIDSDDLIVPNTLEKLLYGISDDADIVFSRFAYIKNRHKTFHSVDHDENFPQKISANEIQKDFLFRKKIVLVPGTLYRKSFLLDNYLFFEKMPWSEDQHFIWRVLLQCRNANFIDEKLYQYVRHDHSIMTSTKIDKIIESYPYIVDVENRYPEGSLIKEYLSARWVIGTLNSATTLCSKKEWIRLYNSIDGKDSFKKMLSFPQFKSRFVAFIGLHFKSLYFIVVSFIKKAF